MKTLIIGYGNIGSIYCEKFLEHKDNELYVLARDEKHQIKLQSKTKAKIVLSDNNTLDIDLIILSVKPQDFKKVSEATKHFISSHTTVVSVMAGLTVEALSDCLNHKRILRAMPNAGAKYGCGMTGMYIAKHLNDERTDRIVSLFELTGKVISFEDENLIDAVTALSGSGPAYYFYLAQQMTNAAEKLGFEKHTANELVLQTFLGAYQLYAHSGKTAEELIAVVASKKGTTEAALKVFEEGNAGTTLVNGILAAEKRAKSLRDEIVAELGY